MTEAKSGKDPMIKIRENNNLSIFISLLVFVVVQSCHSFLAHIHATQYHNNLERGGPWLYRVYLQLLA